MAPSYLPPPALRVWGPEGLRGVSNRTRSGLLSSHPNYCHTSSPGEWRTVINPLAPRKNPPGGPRFPRSWARRRPGGARWAREPLAGRRRARAGARMATRQRGGAVRRYPPGSPFSPPLPALGAAGCQGARRAGVALSLPLALLPGFNLSATPRPARRKSAAIGQVGGSGWFRGGRWEKAGGASGRAEGGGRRVQRPLWQIASGLPSPKCGAGARRSAAAAAPPPPPNSAAWSGLGPPPPLLGGTSPNRFQPDFFFFSS